MVEDRKLGWDHLWSGKLTQWKVGKGAIGTGGELRTEQASVCSLVGQPPNRSKSAVNRTRCEMPVFEEDAITGNDDLVEGQSRLGAIPVNKFINGVLIAALGLE